MRGAFSMGFLAGLKEHGLDYRFFDYYVGTSAGACNMTYFLTDQIEAGLKVWKEYIPNKFIKHKGFSFKENVAFLEKIFRELEPLSLSELAKRKQKAFVALTNFQTKQTDYICLNDSEDPVILLTTSVNWPLFQSPIRIGYKLYYDGGLTAAIPLEKAKLLNSDEIWVVLTTPPGYRRKLWKYKLASLFALHNPQLRRMILKRPVIYNQTLEEIERRKDIVVIRPEQSLPLHWRKTDGKAIKMTLELGKKAAEKMLSKINP